MKELPPNRYGRIVPLIEAAPMRGHRAFAHAVLEGHNVGTVLVDDVDDPRTALVLNASGFWFAFGEPDDWLVAAMVPRLVSTYLPDAVTALFASSPAWQLSLDGLFALRVRRTSFDFQPNPGRTPENWRDHVPEGFAVVPLDEALAARIASGSAMLDPWFVRVAGGAQAIARQGLGVCLRHGETIASFCSFCAIGGGEVELEVGTVEPYRGRGLATLACAALIEQVQNRGLRPAYSAASDNAPSLALAPRLGFVPIEEITGYPLQRDFVRLQGVWGPPAASDPREHKA